MKVRVGLIVNYKTTEAEQSRMSEHRAVCNVQPELPAVVVKVWDEKKVNLKVLLDGRGDIWVTSAEKGKKEGCWNFYPEDKKGKVADPDDEEDAPAPPAGETAPPAE